MGTVRVFITENYAANLKLSHYLNLCTAVEVVYLMKPKQCE